MSFQLPVMFARAWSASLARVAFLLAAVALIVASAPAHAMAPAPPSAVVPQTGTFCAALARNGQGGMQDTNQSPAVDQNTSNLVDRYGVHNGDLCGPTAATHVLGGFADFPGLARGSAVALAGDGNEGDFAVVEKMVAGQMSTDPVINLGLFSFTLNGTFTIDFTGDFFSDIRSSVGSYGSFAPGISASYSGLAPSNLTTNGLADSICQGIWYSSTVNTGYDYWKTQYELQIGMFNINPVKVFGATIGWTIDWTGGHFIPLSAVWPAAGAIAVDNRQEGWGLSWQYTGSETFSIFGIDILNNAATVNLPGQTGNTSVVLGYNKVTLKHGGRCPAGQYNNQGVCQY